MSQISKLGFPGKTFKALETPNKTLLLTFKKVKEGVL